MMKTFLIVINHDHIKIPYLFNYRTGQHPSSKRLLIENEINMLVILNRIWDIYIVCKNYKIRVEIILKGRNVIPSLFSME